MLNLRLTARAVLNNTCYIYFNDRKRLRAFYIPFYYLYKVYIPLSVYIHYICIYSSQKILNIPKYNLYIYHIRLYDKLNRLSLKLIKCAFVCDACRFPYHFEQPQTHLIIIVKYTSTYSTLKNKVLLFICNIIKQIKFLN